jgi:hypothetical protein
MMVYAESALCALSKFSFFVGWPKPDYCSNFGITRFIIGNFIKPSIPGGREFVHCAVRGYVDTILKLIVLDRTYLENMSKHFPEMRPGALCIIYNSDPNNRESIWSCIILP